MSSLTGSYSCYTCEFGHFCRLFHLFERACRALDSKIEARAEENYAEQRESVKKAKKLEERAALFLHHLASSCLSDTEECRESVREMQKEAALLQLKADKIVGIDYTRTLPFIVLTHLEAKCWINLATRKRG